MPANRDPIEGREAICGFLSALREEHGLRFELGLIETVAGTDSAHLIGTYVATAGDGTRAEGVTHEAWTLQADGTWWCSVDMWHDRA
ncbi:hypothetical protein [Pseudonocardia sp. N23]|uniref:hypothetical protein n=1 Tax=Pseudonocardia sp. N23 TaxID=1987376 RepID=UPI000BFD9F31|nr:hypothetical protein [Pseudonocardia sp. N23]GAY07123.1 hypothetical protein TOK_1638 [Pseudonocardia sp. N23]